MNIHDFLSKYRKPMFAPEDETGGGEGAQPDAGAGTDMAEAEAPAAQFGGLFNQRGQEEASDDAEGAEEAEGDDDPDRPEHIPAKFWKDGKTDEEGMAKAYAELEKSYGKLKRDKSGLGDDVPEDAADYFKDGLELGEDVKRLSLEGPDDPGLKAWGDVCHKYGVGKELAANLARDMFGMMDEHAPEAIDPDVEMQSLGKNGKSTLEAVFTWADGAHKSGKLSDDDVGVINSIAGTAKGIRFMSAMRAMAGEEAIPLVDATTGGQMTIDTWDQQFKAAVRNKDYPEQERLEKIGESLFGTEKSHSAPRGRVDHERGLKRSTR